MDDDKIEKLLNSKSYEDVNLGKILLFTKYPDLLKNAPEYTSGTGRRVIWTKSIKEYANIDPFKKRGDEHHIIGFVVNQDFMDF